jgi:hypothetical protein
LRDRNNYIIFCNCKPYYNPYSIFDTLDKNKWTTYNAWSLSRKRTLLTKLPQA